MKYGTKIKNNMCKMHSKGEAKVKVDVELEFQDIAEFEI